MAYQIILKDSVLEDLRQICLGVYDAGQKLTVEELLEKMMDHPEVPIHYPYHHFIMPAALLTLAAMEQSESREALEEMLDTAKVRSMQVPGGVCGNFGTCGAGVGAGIFMSVWTQTTPVSGKTWQWCNELTGRCLQKIASVEGPRCCNVHLICLSPNRFPISMRSSVCICRTAPVWSANIMKRTKNAGTGNLPTIP